MSEKLLDARELIRSGADDGKILNEIKKLVSEKDKPSCFQAKPGMHRIGG